MKTFHYIALALTALLLVTSCAIDEMWSDVELADEQKVLTFKPKFEDFEAVTKAIGDGSMVDKLLVQAYPDGEDAPEFSAEYDISTGSRVENIKIPFFYSKAYKVYFWAYDSDGKAYEYRTDAEGNILLNQPIKVKYPEAGGGLAYNALEHLDAFYSVQTVNLSDDVAETTDISLTRPFAQVNLGALAEDFEDAQVSEAVFKVKDIPSVFTLSDSGVNADDNSETITSPSFTFTDFDLDDDESNITFDNEDYRYIGTTYILVPSLTDKVTVYVAIYGQDPNSPMKEATVELTVGSNKRTNLIFKEIAPSWNDSLADSSEDVPSTETEDGWIHITKPEELAALLIYGGTEGKKYHICANLDMSGMPQTTASQIGLAESGYRKLTIDAGKYNGDKVTGSYMLKNINGIKAFFGIASDLHIQNIILDNVNVLSGDTHVGVLVNSLSGENEFTNVTIQNSSATTTSGAAGGMIGYAGRSSETDRSEPLSVTVDNCKINSTTVAGSQAEGKFVGLLSGYDNGEQLVFTNCTSQNAIVADYISRYVEGNEGAWLSDNNYSAYNGFLGDETYLRGKVYFGGENEATNRFCSKWDGETTVEPIYEDLAEKIAQIWSAFDLAYLQDKSITTINFNENVDLNSKVFTPIKSLSNIDGASKILYNLTVDTMQLESSSSMGGAFVRGISDGTVKDLIFEGAHINVAYDPNGISGNAYAGTLAATVSGTTTITGVNCLNGSVHAICKMGGLIGRVSDGKLSCKNCHVKNYQISNEKAPDKFKETFTETARVQTNKKILITTFTIDLTATAEASFNSEGEVGGLIGFIIGSADIDDCTVSNTIINAFGQLDDHSGVHAVGTAKYKLIWNRTAKLDLVADYTIAGRHVNKFIGDIRPTSDESVTIDNCTADAIRTDDNCFWNNHTCKAGTFDLVGCAYYIGGKVQMDGIDMGKSFGETKGSVKIDGVEILDEAIANIKIQDVLEDLI